LSFLAASSAAFCSSDFSSIATLASSFFPSTSGSSPVAFSDSFLPDFSFFFDFFSLPPTTLFSLNFFCLVSFDFFSFFSFLSFLDFLLATVSSSEISSVLRFF